MTTAWDVWQEYKDDDTVFGIAFFRGDKRVHAIDWQDIKEDDPWMQMTGTGNNMMGFVHFWMDDDRKAALESAAMDWWADRVNDPEYADLVIDIDDATQTDEGEWYIPAHDAEHVYMLMLDNYGYINLI